MRKWRTRLLLYLGALFVFVELANFGIFPRYANFAFTARPDGADFLVTQVDPGSPEARAGLKSGDRIASINGISLAHVAHLDIIQNLRVRVGQSVSLRLAAPAGGAPARAPVLTYRVGANTSSGLVYVFFAILAMYFLSGAYVLAYRWESRAAFWFGWTMTLIGLLQTQQAVARWFGLWRGAGGGATAAILSVPAIAAAALVMPAAIFCLFRAMGHVVTGERRQRPRRFAAWYLGLLAVTAVVIEVGLFNAAFPFTRLPTDDLAGGLVGLCFLIALAGHPLLYFRPERNELVQSSLRLARLMRWTVVVSFVPSLAVLFLSMAVDLNSHATLGRVASYAQLTLGIYPIVMAWAISRRKLFGFQGILRQSLRYAFLSGGLGLVYIVVIASFGVLMGVTRRGSTLWLIAAAGLIAGIVASRTTRAPLHRALDRRFFREAYESEQVLGELGVRLGRYLERDAVERVALEQVDAALHPAWTAIYAGDGPGEAARREQYLARASAAPAEQLRPAAEAGAAGVAPAADQIVYEIAPVAANAAAAPDEEAPWNGAELALALRAQDRWLGWMLLGPKRSEEPYGKRDKALLAAAAGQLAASLANVGLVAEVRRRDRVGQELLMAREVQKRLLPQQLPEIPRLEIAVDYQPAREVGGDYYDVFELSPNVVALAVADVAGKGFSAALLMANLQALVRAQGRNGDVAERVARVNRQLAGSVAPGQFATLLLAELDMGAGRLTYCNAGHEPGILLRGAFQSRDSAARAATDAGSPALGAQPATPTPAAVTDAAAAVAPALDFAALQTGGVPLGLFPEAAYEAESLSFVPGDWLLIHTDGATDAMDAADESFGRERLLAEVAAALAGGEDAAALVRRLREKIDAFIGARAQFDDLTLLAARAL